MQNLQLTLQNKSLFVQEIQIEPFIAVNVGSFIPDSVVEKKHSIDEQKRGGLHSGENGECIFI